MRAWMTADPISAETVLQHVGSDADGAVSLFLGVVRDHNAGRAVHGVRYDAYVEMAERVLGQIAAEAVRLACSDRLAVVHRTGELRVGDVSVAIAVSSPHRAAAFEACRYIIEEIKQRLPVWKQERYVGGEVVWLDGAVPAVRDG